MKRMRVLCTNAVILTPGEMIKKFEEPLHYVTDPSTNTVYINIALINAEMERFKDHLTFEEAAEDVYRKIRKVESNKTFYQAFKDTIPRNRLKK